MANINVTIRIDEDLRQEADVLFEQLGMSTTTAINIFLRQAVREGRIPFEISTTPNNHSSKGAMRYELVKVGSEQES